MSLTLIQLKRIVRRLAKKWRYAIGLGWWKIEYQYIENAAEFSDEDKDFAVFAVTSVKWEYRTALIKLNVFHLRERTKEEIEETLVHEWSHLLIDPCQERRRGQREVAAKLVSDALLWSKREWTKQALKQKARRRKR